METISLTCLKEEEAMTSCMQEILDGMEEIGIDKIQSTFTEMRATTLSGVLTGLRTNTYGAVQMMTSSSQEGGSPTRLSQGILETMS